MSDAMWADAAVTILSDGRTVVVEDAAYDDARCWHGPATQEGDVVVCRDGVVMLGFIMGGIRTKRFVSTRGQRTLEECARRALIAEAGRKDRSRCMACGEPRSPDLPEQVCAPCWDEEWRSWTEWWAAK